jgi:DNA-binding SARP family transcriptional activator
VPVRFAVLGPLKVDDEGAVIDLGPRKQRALLAGLLLNTNRVVTVETLVDLLWGGSPPAAVTASIHGYVALLRRALEPDRAARAEPAVLLTVPGGYRLVVDPDDLDAAVFTRTVQAVHAALTDGGLTVPVHLDADALDRLDDELRTALGLWRGTPYPELDAAADAEADRAHLEELHLTALLDAARVGIARGRAAAVSATLTRLARAHPLREDVWGLLAFSQARTGRQADALDTLRTVREALSDELGLDPNPTLAALELDILRQDPALRPGTAHVPVPFPEPTSPPRTRGVAGPHGGARRAEAGRRHVPGETLLVGRDRELAVLTDLLEETAAGRPRYAMLVGEPGIGKTRLTTELATCATAAGFDVLTGRCSSDEGAPPLWPWAAVMRALPATVGAADLAALLVPQNERPSGVDRFRLFDTVTAALSDAAATRPLLLVLDDLHWADVSTLRLLQHVIEHAAGRLVVVGTRRMHPEPTGAFAELGETLARRHAARLDLVGLATEHVARLAEVTGAPAAAPTADEVRRRPPGTPVFVAELLRRAAAGGHPGAAVPAAVGDVIAVRLAQLPDDTRRLLATAAGLGRTLDVDLLARLDDTSDDAVMDALEPALASGLVVVDTVDGTLRFSHALVRDAVDAAVPALSRQRRHAAVARLLEELPDRGRPTEVARHWLRAGPLHCARAWRSAVSAADYASALSAHEEAADLLRGAVVSQRADVAATDADRYDVLLALAQACRYAADSDGQRDAAARALEIAAADDDVVRTATAAITQSEGALWSNRTEGEVHAPTVEALSQALDRLPEQDRRMRCRVLLALARELFWVPGRRESEAFCARALALAHETGDCLLIADACRTMTVITFRPATLEQRLNLTEEAVAASRQAQDVEAEAVGWFWVAVVSGEAGLLERRADAIDRTMRLSARRRLRYLQIMAGAYEAPWLALHGRFDEADRMLAEIVRWAAHTSFPFRDESVLSARALVEVWRGNADLLVKALRGLAASSPTDMGSFLLLVLMRAERLDDARRLLADQPVPVSDDDFAATLDLSIGAEASLRLGVPGLAARVYPLLVQWPRRTASAGTGAPIGPIEPYLALAAAAVGEAGLAARHADAALDLCAEQKLRAVTAWFTDLRSRYGF